MKRNEHGRDNITSMFHDIHTQLNAIPPKINDYFNVQDFAIQLKRNHTADSSSSLQEVCENYFSKCKIGAFQKP